MPTQITKLLSNHLDAWAVALAIGGLALWIHDAVTLRSAALLVAIAVGYWFAFALNDFYDAPYDAGDVGKARGNFFVTAGPRARRAWMVLAGGVMLLLVGLFSLFGVRGWLTLVLALLVVWAYSAPPLRLKTRPGLDLLAHMLFVEAFPYWLMVVLARTPWLALDTAVLIILCLSSLSAQLEQQVRDCYLDARYERTFTTLVGRQRAHRLMQLATLLLIATAVYFLARGIIPLPLLPYGLIGLPALLHRFVRTAETPRSRALVYALPTAGVAYTAVLLATTLIART